MTDNMVATREWLAARGFLVTTKRFEVHTGRPSWHQQRAGHISAASGVYSTREVAERYQRNYKLHHPDDPCFIIEVRQ